MNILDTIIAAKQKEIVVLQQNDYAFFEMQRNFKKASISLKQKIQTEKAVHLIAEFKRKSPSKGNINLAADLNKITNAYQTAGASAISILTDEPFFGGSNKDIIEVRDHIELPILRKEFIVHEIQLLEAKALGADIILLIAACLTPKQVKALAATAKQLGLEVLLELHTYDEQAHICNDVDFVGINNRNLKDFSVHLEHSINLRAAIGADFIAVAESGMRSVADISMLLNNGFDAFLIGEYLMQQANIENAISAIKNLYHA